MTRAGLLAQWCGRSAKWLLVLTVPLVASEAQADTMTSGVVSDAVDDRPAVITVSKASDALGAPIELRPTRPATGSVGQAATPTGLPVSYSRLTSRFGVRRHPILGGSRMHSGIDLAAAAGSPVVAPADGLVSNAGWRGGYGLLVVIEHGGGLETRFAHLSRLMVSAGQRISRGQLLGLVGSSGRSTGPHLHYEMRRNGLAIDPLSRR
jgi:murein DD-endopeptidase MepM/ murein hydrolase activator NlpD